MQRYFNQAVIIALVAAAGAAFTWIMVVALARPTGPVTINARDIVVTTGAPLPQVRERDTVRAMPETAQPAPSAVYLPGDRVTIPGVYFPFGKIARRDPTAGVATGLTIAHETYMEAGEILPELTGYEAGGVWVRESAR